MDSCQQSRRLFPSSVDELMEELEPQRVQVDDHDIGAWREESTMTVHTSQTEGSVKGLKSLQESKGHHRSECALDSVSVHLETRCSLYAVHALESEPQGCGSWRRCRAAGRTMRRIIKRCFAAFTCCMNQ
jgi:hypothetical protein